MSDRNVSKRRRQSENRRERQARVQRSQAAARNERERLAREARAAEEAAEAEALAAAEAEALAAAEAADSVDERRTGTGAPRRRRGGRASAGRQANGPQANGPQAGRAQPSGPQVNRPQARRPQPGATPPRSAVAGRSGPTPTRGPTRTDRPEPRSAIGRWARRVTDHPGGRWVLIALLGALVGSLMLAFFPVYSRESMPVAAREATKVVHQQQVDAAKAAGDDAPPAYEEPDVQYVTGHLLVELGPGAVILLLVPVLITGLAAWSARLPDPSRTWIISAFAMVLFVMSPLGFGLLYLASAVGLGVGAYQSRKANPRAPRLRPEVQTKGT